MTTIFDAHTMDFTARVQFSQREDGQWFRRIQNRDPRYGYVWTRWTRCGEPVGRTLMKSTRKARLPRELA